MQYPGTVVFVFKDLADHQDGFRIALEPALHGGFLWEVQLIYTDKALLFSILFAQGDQPVVLECGNEMAALARDELEVLLLREPAVHQHEAKLQGVVDTGLDHLAHHLVFGLVTFTLELFGCKVAVLNRLLHQLERHRDGDCHCSSTAH